MRSRSLTIAAGLALPLALVAAAHAGTPTVEVLYSRAAMSPTSLVPGAVDLGGAPVTARFATMLQFWLSPDGSRFLLRGTSDQPSDSSSILLLGSGTTGSVYLQEGRPFPGAIDAEVMDFPSSSVQYPFNASNSWAFSVRSRGGVASTFNKIIRVDAAGAGVRRFQMGDLYTNVTDIATQNSGDETIFNSTLSIHLLNDGRIGWYDSAPRNLHSSRYPVLAIDAVGVTQKGDNVIGFDGVTPILLTAVDSLYQTSLDGTLSIFRGGVDTDLSGGSLPADPDALIVNGRSRIQVGEALPSDPAVVSAIHQMFIAPNNDWYARGTSDSGNAAWATRNGVVIAKTGQSIGTDNWGAATFFTIVGNSNGDWLIAGKSSNTNPAIDDVVVINGQVVLREGDPVSIDINGDGTPDTAYIGRGVNTNAAFTANQSAGLAPDGTAYIIANLRDNDGIDLAASGLPAALIRITFGNTCAADFNNSGSVTVQDIFDFLAAYFSNAATADVNNSGSVTVQDIFDHLARYFVGC